MLGMGPAGADIGIDGIDTELSAGIGSIGERVVRSGSTLGESTLAKEGEETVWEGRDEGPAVGVDGFERLVDAEDAEASAMFAGVESTNLRFLFCGGVGGRPCGEGPGGGTATVPHLDQGGGGMCCCMFIGLSVIKVAIGGAE